MQYPAALTAAALLACATLTFASITIPSDGSDGALNVTSGNLVIDLAQAVTGTWSANNSANAGKGIYDPVKRAIVFKYASVNIASGRTVTFLNHPNRAPVVWLVAGNVVIDGTVSVNGANGNSSAFAAEPGPGGFRGGIGRSNASGFGIGGGTWATGGTIQGTYASGSYAYGNPAVIPLIGGSGGTGSNYYQYGGGAGGGAILIAAPNTISVNGSITANGGTGIAGSNGSSGAIRLVADVVAGTGSVNASTDGRIRLEANSVSGAVVTNPQTIIVVPTTPPTIWQADNAPTAKVTQVDTAPVPLSPTAPLETNSDVGVSVNSAVSVTVQTTNFPTNGLVRVRVTPKYTTNVVFATAAYQSGDANSALWTATVTFPVGMHTVLQAIATAP